MLQTKNISWLGQILKIFTQVYFIFIFLTIFYFTYVVKVERQIFQTQIYNIITQLSQQIQNNYLILLPTETRNAISNDIHNFAESLQVPPSSHSQIDANNRALEKKSIELVVSISVILLGGLTVIYLTYISINFPSSLMENIIVVFFIGLTEFLFLHFVTRAYQIIDAQQVQVLLLKQTISSLAEKNQQEVEVMQGCN